MSRLLRIAAREYLSYVRTVGFWLSLVAMPLVLSASLAIPSMMDKTAPPTRLAIVDFSHRGFGPALAARLAQDPPGRRYVLVSPPPEVASAPDIAVAGERLHQRLAGDAAHVRAGRSFDAAAVIGWQGRDLVLNLWTTNLIDGRMQAALHDDLADVARRQRLLDSGVSPALIDAADQASPRLTVYSPKAEAHGKVSLRDELPQIIGFAMGMLLWTTIISGAGILLNSVIEEKSSRILEVLLTSASVPEVMGGKILGVMAVTGTVLTVWLGVGAGAAASLMPGLLQELLAVLVGKGLIFYFGLYLVLGYLMYASIFTAVGAFCETVREAQTLLGPMMVILSVPLVFMGQSINHPDAPVLTALSWVPPFTPFLMAARVANEPPLWQIGGTLALMLATTAAVVWLSGRAFRAGALSIGKVDRKAILAAFMGRGG
jgi:ABC-2 type transport system permease protein